MNREERITKKRQRYLERRFEKLTELEKDFMCAVVDKWYDKTYSEEDVSDLERWQNQ